MSILSSIKHIFAKEDLRTDDRLGVYPEKVHVPAFLERRYLKTSRALAILCVVSMAINMILGTILFLQPSMVSSQPVNYAYNKSFGGFKELEKMYVRKSASDMIFEEQIREYIYIRNKVYPDVDIMKYAWQPGNKFYWMSGRDVYSRFTNSEYKRVMESIVSDGFRQDVYFKWSRKIKGNQWVAEFDTYEYTGWQYKTGIRKKWRVYLRAVINKNIPYDSLEFALRNPLNVNIISYDLVSIAIKDEN